jgi:hypothetical protein
VKNINYVTERKLHASQNTTEYEDFTRYTVKSNKQLMNEHWTSVNKYVKIHIVCIEVVKGKNCNKESARTDQKRKEKTRERRKREVAECHETFHNTITKQLQHSSMDYFRQLR